MSAPVLWHISFSNFNEKARWALDLLEDFFDEQLGHEVRRVAMDAIRRDPRIGAAAALPQGGPLARNGLTLALAPMGIAVRRYYGVNPAAVQRAWELIGAAIDRFQAELQPSGLARCCISRRR
jgi:hypothetical protein